MKKIISLLLCFAMLFNVALAAVNIPLAQTLAEDLKELNLFFGVSGDNNFDLERAPTRVEALVMLIRVLGKEDEALSGTWSHPFTDVPQWADKYVGYGYEHGLANGVGYTTFGTGRANAAMYLTFVLRALGYTEAADGFTWDNPFALAREVGILTSQVDTTNFLRADVVLVSYAALSRPLKGEDTTLAEKLIEAEVFTKEQYKAYYDLNAISEKESTMSAEQIYENCSPAVFYIEVSDRSGTAIASGSGFFLSSDGVAVTNYHVIKDAYSAEITLSDSEKKYEIAGVLSYNEKEDWAVIKINGRNFPYIEIGGDDTVVGGAEIYAIGSPLGLQNTISQGIISNTQREINGRTYIQITAAISSGSSGGALINKYGQVIGITSASIEAGQSINMAVPISKIKDYEGAEVKTLASLNGEVVPPSTETSSGDITPGDVIAKMHEIATEKSTFNYGDYVGWKGKSDDGKQKIDIVYSVEHDTVFIDYDVYLDSGSRYNMFIMFSEDETKDYFTASYYQKGAEEALIESTGSVVRSEVTKDDSNLRFGEVETTARLSGDSVSSFKEASNTVYWLAIKFLDDALVKFTDGEYRVKHLGYINVYE